MTKNDRAEAEGFEESRKCNSMNFENLNEAEGFTRSCNNGSGTGIRHEENKEESVFDWVEAYTIARNMLHWSDEEFFKATPRKYFACFYTSINMHRKISSRNQKVFRGAEAIDDIKSLMNGLK